MIQITSNKKLSRKERNELLKANQTIGADGQTEQSGQPTGQSEPSSSVQPSEQSVQSTSPTSPTSQPTSIQLKEGSKQDPSKQVTDEMHTQISFFTFPSLDLIRCILNDCDSAQTIVDLSSVTNSCCIGVICESRQLLILRFRFYFY